MHGENVKLWFSPSIETAFIQINYSFSFAIYTIM